MTSTCDSQVAKAFSATARFKGVWFAYVGCRTTVARQAKGKGLSVYEVAVHSGTWELKQVVEGLENPSYLLLNQREDRLYVVHGDGADVSCFAIDPDHGTVSLLNRQSCNGTNPVHLALSEDERQLIVANYATGTLAALGIAADGSLEPVRLMIGLPGQPGPHRIEQSGAHPHHVPRFVNRQWTTSWHIVPDKGLDAVFAVQLGHDAAATRLRRYQSRESAGPRHAAFHPHAALVYVGNELDSTVTTLTIDTATGDLAATGHISTLPGSYSGPNRVAGIVMHASGRMLFASNRGHDSVACIPIDVDGQAAPPVAFAPALGECPRFITLTPDGRHLIVANERSHTIVARTLDPETLLPETDAVVVESGSPVCVVFANA